MIAVDEREAERWSLYLADCNDSNVTPSMKDYLVWLQEQNFIVVEDEYEAAP